MKLGFTADLHLSTIDQHPERYNSLKNILDQSLEEGIEILVLAGDVFDSSMHNYSEFESICSNRKYAGLKIQIIPGNHDPQISSKKIVGSNISLFTEPHWEKLSNDWSLLFIPYLKDRLMGDVIQGVLDERKTGKWILVGHGDFGHGSSNLDAYEQGIYMPLTQKDINQFKPDLVILGHIHMGSQIGNLHYPGSPCALDITETGYRHFLIFDTDKGSITSQRIINDRIMFNERLLILPLEDEETYLKDQIANIIHSWDLESGDEKKTIVRIKVRGVSTDRKNLHKMIRRYFKGFILENEPDISEVSSVDDPEREFLMAQFLEILGKYELPSEKDDPHNEEIILDALRLIYLEA